MLGGVLFCIATKLDDSKRITDNDKCLCPFSSSERNAPSLLPGSPSNWSLYNLRRRSNHRIKASFIVSTSSKFTFSRSYLQFLDDKGEATLLAIVNVFQFYLNSEHKIAWHLSRLNHALGSWLEDLLSISVVLKKYRKKETEIERIEFERSQCGQRYSCYGMKKSRSLYHNLTFAT
ncbi:hypothetical protein BGZ60DRAFT_102127 [Tricladium varicosporioides]|nr:hypothetical protein BGZ60DRAFT_102127 [Hymenoscyphus varicosporioides]